MEVVEQRLRSEDLVCPECGSTMAEIGKEVRRKVKLEPAKLTVVEDWYYSYACRKCEQESIKTPVVKAAGEPNFIPGSFATPEAVAHIATQKFVMGSLLYRQEQELNRQGVPLKRQTVSNWLVLYEYQPDKKGERPKEFLTGFRGYLHIDGYSVYHDLQKNGMDSGWNWKNQF